MAAATAYNLKLPHSVGQKYVTIIPFQKLQASNKDDLASGGLAFDSNYTVIAKGKGKDSVSRLSNQKIATVWLASQLTDRSGWLCFHGRGKHRCIISPQLASCHVGQGFHVYKDSTGELWYATISGIVPDTVHIDVYCNQKLWGLPEGKAALVDENQLQRFQAGVQARRGARY